MSVIINQYPVFEGSQVLTSAQLNSLVAYLDQQNRLTRVKLIGIGVVCGLELRYNAPDELIITEGTAITSEGFLLSLGECEITFYRPYTLPDGVEYRPFGFPVQDVELHELLTSVPDDPTGVEPLSEAFLSDKFVLLFLECYDNDLKPCITNTCDEKGIDRIFTLRKLVISRDDLDKVLTRSDNIEAPFPDDEKMMQDFMPKVLLDPGKPHSTGYKELAAHYRNNMELLVKKMFSQTNGLLIDSYEYMLPLLGHVYRFANPFSSTIIKNLITEWNTYLSDDERKGIQYFYDFIYDLLIAYEEYRLCALELMGTCCPDMSLFPKHVMLGRANTEAETSEERRTYRHGFSQTPIYNQQKYLREKTIALHHRLVLMVEQFNLAMITKPDDDLPVHITPSSEKKEALGERIIPYYYKPTTESKLIPGSSLEQYWNYDITRKTSGLVQIGGYHRRIKDVNQPGTVYESPLLYTYDRKDFLRIEGHHCKKPEDVITILREQQRQFNLPFDLIALRISTSGVTRAYDYSCGFHDLQEDYNRFRKDFCLAFTDLQRLYEVVASNPDLFFDENQKQRLALLKQYLDLVREKDPCSQLPDCVVDFDFDAFRKLYSQSLNELGLFLFIVELDAPVFEDPLFIEYPFLFGFINAATYTVGFELFYALKHREYFMDRITDRFADYLEQHPGITHHAGVFKGGTFLLVHDGSEVVADFALPYRCCKEAVCFPACEEIRLSIAMPALARPDFAVTTIGTPVTMNVIMNDILPDKASYSVKLAEEEVIGGKVELQDDFGTVRFTPDDDFSGLASFQYLLTNVDTGESSIGAVFILVEDEEQPSPCKVDRVQGNVVDDSTSEVLPGVNVAVKGSDRQTTTNAQGNYVLELDTPGQKLVVSFKEYIPQEIQTCNKANINIRLVRKEVLIPDLQVVTEDERALLNIARDRNIATDDTDQPEVLIERLTSSERGNRFTVGELEQFTNPTLRVILESKGLNAPSSATKSELISRLR